MLVVGDHSVQCDITECGSKGAERLRRTVWSTANWVATLRPSGQVQVRTTYYVVLVVAETREDFSCIIPRGLPFFPLHDGGAAFLDQPHCQLRQPNPMLTLILTRVYWEDTDL